MSKIQTFPRDPIKPGRLHDSVAVCAGVGVALIVRNTEEDVWAFSADDGCRERRRDHEEKGCFQGIHFIG